ncbi:multisubstrate pseudouridine synthase 7 [Cichlidogyrus casuarinus]|uniref:Multisubstrate pseudouridine synthase 7 n=1 Tax=Cichlidogyrus casuarinus TaxID=1844966 RepID=A0ABD2QL87_9PLAT
MSVAKLSSLEPPIVKIEINSDFSLNETQKNELKQVIDCEKENCRFEASELKEVRSAMHQAIKRFDARLFTKYEDGAPPYIVVSLFNSDTSRDMNRKFLSKEFPYCKFVLYKEGKDTAQALQIISRILRNKPDAFVHAGNKDKRAITYQYITIKYCEPSRLAAINSKLRGIKMGSFERVERPLFLGSLYGNKFTIVLRELNFQDQEGIRNAISSLSQNGFINYFGLQRFGHSLEASTSSIGKCILKDDFEAALKIVLEPTLEDLPEIRKCKEDYKANPENLKQILSEIPRCLERDLLFGISKHGRVADAFQKLPRTSRMLYVHSYQSLIWNKVVSRRISTHGLKVLVGDLVMAKENLVKAGEKHSMDADESQNDWHESKKIITVTEDSLEKYQLDQVLLPIPGHAILYPSNECAQYYNDLFAEDSISSAMFKHRIKDFSLPGSYRNILVKPQDIAYEFVTYKDLNLTLVQTDIDLLNQVEADGDSTDKSNLALKISFSLPKSSYATMALREISSKIVTHS